MGGFFDTPIMDSEEIVKHNMAFIDGQNLHLGTKEAGWAVDHAKFRIYLKDKYLVEKAYYFLGFILEKEQGLYDKLKEAGFILIFKEHDALLKGLKKGNVDADIIFEIMKTMIEDESLHEVYIVSGDGDYKKLVDYLINKNNFGKILFPNKKFSSSLYMSLEGKSFDYLEEIDVKAKIEYVHK